jgi:hypothetical protein
LTKHRLGVVRDNPGQARCTGDFGHRLPQETTQLHLNIGYHVLTSAPTSLVSSERKAPDGIMTSAQMLQEALG